MWLACQLIKLLLREGVAGPVLRIEAHYWQAQCQIFRCSDACLRGQARFWNFLASLIQMNQGACRSGSPNKKQQHGKLGVCGSRRAGADTQPTSEASCSHTGEGLTSVTWPSPVQNFQKIQKSRQSELQDAFPSTYTLTMEFARESRNVGNTRDQLHAMAFCRKELGYTFTGRSLNFAGATEL
ncbi:hypothetical protein QBC46DRAFT_444758 [Diplogelasinospora grovesii]|uniref:Uncharacterized protein n=1 Tax=Diplogelasinospora grovesii TaxID=303347 RepID=A0AAN6NJF7_9PEZI|nr:hypothetical protein QBC46DRAFT_444758 [Diplogelasinospora grovesii]